jgi:hypothetical protein
MSFVVLISPRTPVVSQALAHSPRGQAVELQSLPYAYTQCDALPFRTHYAVYDSVLSVWPISHISLHRLRLDLHDPKCLFSACPSRGRGESEETVRGSPVLRVFEENGEEVAGTKTLAEKQLQEHSGSQFLRKCSRRIGFDDA